MIMSGTINLSGSNVEDLPVAALFFERDGSTRMLLLEKENHEDTASIMLVNEYLQYAMSKSAWMSEFMHELSSEESKKINEPPKLRIIKGGLSLVSGTL